MHSLLGAAAAAIWAMGASASMLTPPVLPLIVRNPYLSTWMQDARDVPWSRWPMFYTGMEIGMSVMAAVPSTETVYPLFGRPHDAFDGTENGSYNLSFPQYRGVKYDASITNFTYNIPGKTPAGDVEIVLSFLSPITPTSTLRQSIPASYLSIHVCGSTDVDVYIDLNGQWVSGDRTAHITWSHSTMPVEGTAGLRTFKVSRSQELLFTERGDRAEWGTLYFTGPADASFEAGTSAHLRNRFSAHGKLQDTTDTRFRGIMDDEPVFAFSKSFHLSRLANETSSKLTPTDSVLFTIAHIQDPVVQFAAARGLTFMRPLWKSWFDTDDNLINFHYTDFHNAFSLAANYSAQLALDAFESGSHSYVDIVSLSARQVMGGTSFSGTPDNPILFLKEISSSGNLQTIDIIYPAFPFFLYTNPRWLAYLLEPVIEHTLSGLYPNTYTMHDLGTHFPNATGHADGRDEYMPLEECGNILIMGLALVQSLQSGGAGSTGAVGMAGSPWAYPMGAGSVDYIEEEFEDKNTSPFRLRTMSTKVDGKVVHFLDDNWGGGAKGMRQAEKWVERSYRLWKQWTGYLVDLTLEPQNQLSTDDFAGPLALQTNLALKGIIGIKAMSGIAQVVGQDVDAEYYRNISEVYIAKWEEYGMSRDGGHAKLAYDWYGSWTTLYNLFGDSLLCFHMEGTDAHPSPPETQNRSARYDGGSQKILLGGGSSSDVDGGKGERGKGFTPHRIYKAQSEHYMSVRQKYGLPLDSRHRYTKTDWEFFAIAVAGAQTRRTILDSVARWINETTTDKPFTDLHETEGSGGWPPAVFFARPVVGGHFAFLALERACGGKAMQALGFLDE